MPRERSSAQKTTGSGLPAGTYKPRSWNRLTTCACAWCGEMFKPRQITKVFCSKKCGHAARARKVSEAHAKRRGGGPAIQTRECLWCEQPFEVVAYLDTQHCSVRCSKLKLRPVKNCLTCGEEFTTRNLKVQHCSRKCSANSPGRKRRPVTNPKVERECLGCGTKFRTRSSGKSTTRYCSQSCGISHSLKGKPRPDCSLRQKTNPSGFNKNDETRAAAHEKLKGRTFLSRGGNGKLTKPQMHLREALGLPEDSMECVVSIIEAIGHFPSLPSHYKIDIGIPDIKLSIEVDGNSHKTKKWKFLDRRKTEILNFLGWSVLRFWNKEVLQETDRVVSEIRSTILRLRTLTLTTPTES